MPDRIEINIATIEDAVTLARLNVLFNDSREGAEQIAQRMIDPHRVETPLLALVNGRAVGFAALRLVPCVFYPEPHAELTELYVEPEYRRRGIGRALVVYAEGLAVLAGATELFILTGADNQEALSLYRALGYEDYDLALHKEF
jgi:ribosomal protein S18 acetylase RimI-like enzyme